MSYVRWGSDGSDVYVFECVGNTLECCGCSLGGVETNFHTRSFAAMIDHLLAHRDQGDHVPPWVDDTLREDAAERGADLLPLPCECCGGTGRHVIRGALSLPRGEKWFDPCDECNSTGNLGGDS